MPSYRGICRGGPRDGQGLEHTWKIYKIAILPPLSLKAVWQEPEPPQYIALKYGSYAYVLGQWVWRGEDANC